MFVSAGNGSNPYSKWFDVNSFFCFFSFLVLPSSFFFLLLPSSSAFFPFLLYYMFLNPSISRTYILSSVFSSEFWVQKEWWGDAIVKRYRKKKKKENTIFTGLSAVMNMYRLARVRQYKKKIGNLENFGKWIGKRLVNGRPKLKTNLSILQNTCGSVTQTVHHLILKKQKIPTTNTCFVFMINTFN